MNYIYMDKTPYTGINNRCTHNIMQEFLYLSKDECKTITQTKPS